MHEIRYNCHVNILLFTIFFRLVSHAMTCIWMTNHRTNFWCFFTLINQFVCEVHIVGFCSATITPFVQKLAFNLPNIRPMTSIGTPARPCFNIFSRANDEIYLQKYGHNSISTLYKMFTKWFQNSTIVLVRNMKIWIQDMARTLAQLYQQRVHRIEEAVRAPAHYHPTVINDPYFNITFDQLRSQSQYIKLRHTVRVYKISVTNRMFCLSW